ncbi:MAG: WhiB family transcriptional regulator [Ilumatobacteraceae bacterium]
MPELPPPRPEWMRRAACRGMTHVMFPGQGDDVRPAIAICHGCPVAEPCLEYAVDNVERFGIWAGTADKERRRLRSQRRRAATTEERSA